MSDEFTVGSIIGFMLWGVMAGLITGAATYEVGYQKGLAERHSHNKPSLSQVYIDVDGNEKYDSAFKTETYEDGCVTQEFLPEALYKDKTRVDIEKVLNEDPSFKKDGVKIRFLNGNQETKEQSFLEQKVEQKVEGKNENCK